MLCGLLLAQPARADGLPDLGDASAADLSPQMERRIGETIMRDLRQREAAYVEDAEIAAYLNGLGGRLVAQVGEGAPEFEFFAVRDPTLNAFALPGGYVGVHTGLILAAQSESELAGVLAHEISHVTQHHIARLVGQQKQAGLVSLAALVVAILASRGNGQMAEAAAATGTAVGVQSQLNYTRDFEREADRLGMQILDAAGFDVRAMASFFERLQQFGRLYENNAPAYLRTHPLTTERIADMANRAAQRSYRQVPDSLAFQLVRAKLRSEQGTPQDAVAEFEAQLRERKFAGEAAARYGLARAKLRIRDAGGAQREVAALRKLGSPSPMIEGLAAEVALAQGRGSDALAILAEARDRFPQERALGYAQIEALLALDKPREALRLASDELRLRQGDARAWRLQARAYSALGKRLQQHRALAEVYALQGQYAAAVEQLEIAQKAGDGDFYEQSAVDARLREMRTRLAEASKKETLR